MKKEVKCQSNGIDWNAEQYRLFLMLLNFPLPPFPNFLFIDFSDIPALIAALIFGPVAGILVEFFKNGLDYIMTGSANRSSSWSYC